MTVHTIPWLCGPVCNFNILLNLLSQKVSLPPYLNTSCNSIHNQYQYYDEKYWSKHNGQYLRPTQPSCKKKDVIDMCCKNCNFKKENAKMHGFKIVTMLFEILIITTRHVQKVRLLELQQIRIFFKMSATFPTSPIHVLVKSSLPCCEGKTPVDILNYV